jgi:hypothetical protein
LIEIACWAHSRRYFFEAQTFDLCRATVMLAYIQLLYEVEREARARNATAEQRRELRQAKSRPVLEDIKNYLQTEKPKVLPKSPMCVAIDTRGGQTVAFLRTDLTNLSQREGCGLGHLRKASKRQEVMGMWTWKSKLRS